MGLFKLKDFWKSSVYITPNLPVIQTRRYKIQLPKILTYLGFYTFVIIILVITVLAFTDAKNIIFILERSELKAQAERISKLENQVIFLRGELESISSTERKLKYAILLADSAGIDSNSAIYDSLKAPEKNFKPNEGNITAPFLFLIDKIVNFLQSEDTLKIFFVKPVPTGVMTNNFNARSGHMGIDYGVKIGTPVYAASGGLIIFAGYTVQDGYKIIIEHKRGFISVYKHCSEILKKEREFVRAGELIALSGNSGYNTTGPHLHFEIWQNGKPINPQTVLIN